MSLCEHGCVYVYLCERKKGRQKTGRDRERKERAYAI